MAAIRLGHITGILSCGWYKQQAGTQPGGPLLAPGREKIELVTGGRGWIAYGGEEIEVTAGSLIWHVPGDRLIMRSDHDAPYACLTLIWAVSAPDRQCPHLTRWNDTAEVIATTRQLSTAFSDERVDRAMFATCSYTQMLWRALLHVATATGTSLPDPLAAVLAEVEAAPERDWAVEDLCRIAGWQASRLHGAFRQHLRTSPHQHLLDLRLRRARELLATGDEDLGSIARSCGLGSAAALCRRFRRSSGMTPGEYRERQR